MEIPEFLKNLKYKNINDFDEKTEHKLRQILGLTDLIFSIPYAKIYEQNVSVICRETNKTLWNTRIQFVSFVLIDADDIKNEKPKMIDHFTIPLRPFRLRSAVEIDEMNNLLQHIQNEFDQINEYFEIPDMFDSQIGDA